MTLVLQKKGELGAMWGGRKALNEKNSTLSAFRLANAG